ncbi:phosphatidylinositol N-acetylglucosaminyltransferase subunit H isoform X2 [Ahaetulla prasina]|uniref:phosphatidylinositol N-acetylglucosaminyltransferase subunit H isoform X2 n=1 Tax=Ahaetulla prasina TaxID=499056 RepID=UPI0026496C08|nr:phosphatidylinositol N-acetylglucosaminyltransferase subunit H isoform X2 [Ahaetulla prasina]
MAEEREYLSVSGARIKLRPLHHSASCRELQVRCPRLQLGSLSAVTCCVWLVAYGLFVVSQESLLIIDSLGIQMTSSYASGKESTTFIEMNQVKDVVINEAIYMQKVIYYLCILLQDPTEPHAVSEVVPLFQSSMPRLDCLVDIYKNCQEILEQRKKS